MGPGVFRPNHRKFPFLAFLVVARRIRGPRPPGTDVAAITDFFLQYVWDHHRRAVVARFLPSLASWALLCVRFLRKGGRAAARAGGPPPRAQLGKMARLAFRHALVAKNYYRYALYLDERAPWAADYVPRHLLKDGLYSLLEIHTDDYDPRDLDDKDRFFRLCERTGLPSAAVLATVEPGSARCSSGLLRDAGDLFVKPRDGRGGRDAFKLTASGTGWRVQSGELVEQDAVAEWLIRLANETGQAFVVQRCLASHPDLQDLAPSALPTIRVCTLRSPEGDIQVVRATMRIGRGDAVVDNFHQGGLGAPVDVATGKLGPAMRMDQEVEAGERFEAHPDTGGIIAGRRLPHWSGVADLAVRAHDAVGPFPFLGWDVAVTDAGPVLIEGNSQCGPDIVQIPQRVPLGATAFGPVMRAHVRRLEERIGPPAG